MASLKETIRLAREEIDGVQTDSTDNVEGTLDVVEQIKAEESQAELAQIESETEAQTEAIEEVEEVAGDLEEQVTENEEIIQAVNDGIVKQEEVQPEHVQASQEALKIAMVRFGENIKEASCFVSHEEVKADPFTALKISNESVKDLLKKAWDMIRRMFKSLGELAVKFFNWIKKGWEVLTTKAKALLGKLRGKEAAGETVLNADDEKLQDVAETIGEEVMEATGGDVDKMGAGPETDVAGTIAETEKELNQTEELAKAATEAAKAGEDKDGKLAEAVTKAESRVEEKKAEEAKKAEAPAKTVTPGALKNAKLANIKKALENCQKQINKTNADKTAKRLEEICKQIEKTDAKGDDAALAKNLQKAAKSVRADIMAARNNANNRIKNLTGVVDGLGKLLNCFEKPAA